MRHRPDIYSRLARGIVAPLWAKKERSPYLLHLRYLEGSQFRPIEEVRADQLARLKKLLEHAYENTDYYRQKLTEAGISPDAIRSLDDLKKIPVLTKEDIRSNKDSMVARNFARETLIAKKTSGSTGVSLDFFVDDESRQWKRACALRHDRWAGWDIGEKVGAIWGNPEYKKSWKGCVRNCLLERYTYLDTLKMDPAAMLDFYRDIKRQKPTLLFGHAHSIYLFAKFLKSRSLSDVRPKGIISTAMVLHDFERALIEEVFGCKVTNRYGCEEVSLIACECREHNGLHMNMDTLVVEFVCADGSSAPTGTPGMMVVTDLTNYGMPFIRYKVGDVGVPSSRRCACGCTYPLIESLEGRIADYVVTPGGEYISGISLTENFAMLLRGIKQIQIVQEEIDRIIFRIVKGEDFSEDVLHELNRLAMERFGPKMTYCLEFPESIQQESSGKYRFCISKLDKEAFGC